MHQPEIEVKASDRWTLLAVPNIYAGDGKRSVGVFVYDSNLFGYGKTAGLGGAVTTEGNSFSLFYFDPAVRFSDYTFRARVMRSSSEYDAYSGRDIVYGFDRVEQGVDLGPGYRITPDLTASLSLQFADRSFSRLDQYSVPADYRTWSLGADLRFRQADYKLYYNAGLTANLGWSRQLSRSDDGDKLDFVTARLEWDREIYAGQALQLGWQGNYQSAATAGDVAMYGRGKGYRGIQPDGLWTGRIAALSVDYQIPVGSWRHGTVTVAPFCDFGVYKPFLDDNDSHYLAYGLGAYYFPNFINLPGLGLTFGQNDDFMGAFAAFQFGMGFQ